ncbi:MAG: BTAD domain-containing putative transcriptional regulator, partial [Cyanobacteria bacterium J06639_16]
CAFTHIIWRSLRNAPPLEELLEELVPFVSDRQDSKATPRRLLHWLRQSRCLLILDNMETILHGGDRAGYFRAGYEGYGDLLQWVAETRHQSSVILTSREKPAVVGALAGIDSPVRSLQLSGSLEAALSLIDAKGLIGTGAEKHQLCDRYGRSPLTLKIVATSIQSLFDGKIALFLAENTLVFNDLQRLLDEQFDRLSTLEQTVMYWLAINRDWTSISELVDDIQPSITRHQVLAVLESLCWRSLIETRSGHYTQQGVVIEYVTHQLNQQIAAELITVELSLFLRHALIKTTLKDYLRDSQMRLILQPIASQFRQTFSAKAALEQQILRLLTALRRSETQLSGYGCGNLINLCCHLGVDLTDYDFSNLSIRHAYLPTTTLHRVNFAHAKLTHAVFTQTFSSILSIAFSCDRQMLAAGDSNGQIWIWRSTDHQSRLIIQGHTDWAGAVAFSPDGQLLASGGDDAMIHLWDITAQQRLKTLSGHTNYVQTIAFHPNGQLASGSHDGTIKLWDVQFGNAVQTLLGHTAPVRSVAFSPDGNYLASGSSDCTVKLWDYPAGTCLATLEGHTDRIWAVAWHPNSQTLASGSSDQTIRLWHVPTQTCTQIWEGHVHAVLALDFSPNGQLLGSSSSGQTIKLWDVQTGNCLRTLREHQDWVWALAFSSNQQLASGGDDQILKFWDVHTGQCLKTLRGFTNQIFSVAFHPGQPWLASGGSDRITRIWNWLTGATLTALTGHTLWIRTTEFSPDGQYLASGSLDKTIRLWQVSANAQPRLEQPTQILQGHTDSVRSLAWHPHSEQLASGSGDRTIRIWQVSTGECRHVLQGHTKMIRSIAWNPVQPCLASVGDDETLRIWDTTTGQQLRLLKGHEKWLLTVAWHPNGKLLASGSADHTIRLWNGDSGELLQVLIGHSSQVQSVVFSPVEPILASGSGDSTLKLWDLETGKVLQTLVGHTNQVQKVAFTADGRTLASGSNDGTIKLWQRDTGNCIRSLQATRPYEGMNIEGVQGLTAGQLVVLKALGAVDRSEAIADPPPLSPILTDQKLESHGSKFHQSKADTFANSSVPTGTNPDLAWAGSAQADSIIKRALERNELDAQSNQKPVPTLQIQVLGGFSLHYNGEPLSGLTNERSQALLAYLVLHRHAPQPRQHLAFVLYPDIYDAHARTALRKDLFKLRQALPNAEQFIQIEAKTIQWNKAGSFTLDMIDFEAALNQVAQRAVEDLTGKQCQLKAAIAQYRGELLPSLDYDWIVQAREQLHQRYLNALDELIRLLEQQQQYRQAIRYGQQLLQAEPLRESTYQTLMQLQGEHGDRAAAIQTYHQCMIMLRDELGIDPSPETQRVYQTLLA